MATGMAKGASTRGKSVAFGDGKRVIWDQHSEIIFRRNPNIAPRVVVDSKNVEWVKFYKGHRIYNTQGHERWIWNYDFKATPGELFLDKVETLFGQKVGNSYIVIEPNVPAFKTVAPNKQWPVERYDEVARRLKADGYRIVQFRHQTGHHKIPGSEQLTTLNIRLALSALKFASLYIGAEGGLHHGAAAFAVPAVVLFGGFVPPSITGYDFHENLTGGAKACGSWGTCSHCREAMDRISVDEVYAAAQSQLRKSAA